jgi:hypothetical protein
MTQNDYTKSSGGGPYYPSPPSHNHVYVQESPVYVQEVPPVAEAGSDSGGPTTRQVGGAAAVGAVAGLVLGGPLLAIVGGVAVAAIATSNNKAGKVARSSGDVAADAGQRLKKFDEKHHVVEKTSNQIVKGCKWISKKLNAEKPNSNNNTNNPPSTNGPGNAGQAY